jgi:hypothetical protein
MPTQKGDFFEQGSNYSDAVGIAVVGAGSIGQGLVKYVSLSVGTSAYTVTPAAAPTNGWNYLQVLNTHATGVVKVAINESPVDAPAADPGVAGDWEAGYPVGPGGSALIPLSGVLTTIRLLSDTASTTVLLGLVA